MALPGYENLTDFELTLADHFAETGNTTGLQQLRNASAERTCKPTIDKEED